jgi:hypothetical protein
MVAATPPPSVTVALCQSTLPLSADEVGEAAFAASISDGLNRAEVLIGVFAVGIAARDYVKVFPPL